MAIMKVMAIIEAIAIINVPYDTASIIDGGVENLARALQKT